MRRFLLAAAVVGGIVSGGLMGWSMPVLAAPAAGSLIKLVSDNNPATTVDSALYFLADNGERYVFPNESTYRTWYTDFSNVIEVDATTLASLPIGGNVTYRPGTRLVKITTDPKVYVVQPGGVLRQVRDESMAVTLFGADWAKRVDDVPDAFFVNYSVGSALEIGQVPLGALIRRQSDGALFLTDVSGRLLVGSNELTAARLNILNALTLSDAMVNGLADAGALSAQAAASLAWPVAATVAVMPVPVPTPVTTPTLSVRSLPAAHQAYVRGTRGAEVARFGFSVTGPEAFTISALNLQGYVDQQESANGFSLGEDNSSGILLRLRDLVDGVSLVDVATGQVLMGPLGVTEDGRLQITGLNIRLLPGATEKVLALVGDVDQDVNLLDNPDRIAFDIENGLVDIVARNDAGSPLNTANVLQPNGGNLAQNFVEIRWYGNIDMSWHGATTSAVRGTEVRLGQLDLTGSLDNFTLHALTFRDGINALAGFANFRLVYRDAAGVEQSVSGARNSDLISFNGFAASLPKDQMATVVLYGTPDLGAQVGSQVQLVLAPEIGLSIEPQTLALNIDQPSVENGAVTVLLNAASNVTVQ